MYREHFTSTGRYLRRESSRRRGRCRRGCRGRRRRSSAISTCRELHRADAESSQTQLDKLTAVDSAIQPISRSADRFGRAIAELLLHCERHLLRSAGGSRRVNPRSTWCDSRKWSWHSYSCAPVLLFIYFFQYRILLKLCINNP